MLDSHPEITGCEGFEFIVDEVGDDGTPPEMSDYWDFLSTHHIFGSSGLVIDRSLDYPELVDSFLQQRLELSGKKQASAMVHWNFARLLHLWPNARFIHLLRDPRDVAQSVNQMHWYGNVWTGVGKWTDAEREWGLLVPQLRTDQFIEVGFADLIADHETQLNRVCEFLGVRYTEHMLDYAKDTDYAVPDPSKVSQWGRTLSERDIRLVEGRVGPLLSERGFEPSGLEPIEPRRVERLLLGVDNRLRMWQRRIQRFGLRLFLERGVARLVPNESYRSSVALRYNEIERSHRKRSWRSPGREFSVTPDRAE